MYTSYYVNSKKLEIFYSSNIKFKKEIYVYWNNRKKKAKKTLFKDKNKSYYFKWDGYKIYIDDFIIYSIAEIKRYLESNKYFSIDMFWSCIYKYKDDVVFKINEPKVYKFPIINITYKKDHYVDYIPYETEDYPKERWFYMIKLVPLDEIKNKFISMKIYYFSDLYQDVIKKNIIIESKNNNKKPRY